MTQRAIFITTAAALAIGACSDRELTSISEVPSDPSSVLYGQPDGSDHPYVGFSIFFYPSVPGWFRCSGALLEDQRTFLVPATALLASARKAWRTRTGVEGATSG